MDFAEFGVGGAEAELAPRLGARCEGLTFKFKFKLLPFVGLAEGEADEEEMRKLGFSAIVAALVLWVLLPLEEAATMRRFFSFCFSSDSFLTPHASNISFIVAPRIS